MTFLSRFILLWAVIPIAGCLAQMGGSNPYSFPEKIGTIQNNRLKEISGIVHSTQNKDILWMINDSGNGPYLFAVNHSGTLVATYKLEDAKNRDWEDLATFVYNDQPWLVIGDVGDNDSKRKSCTLYFLTEPLIAINHKDRIIPMRINQQMTFTYENGAKDCESIAVDIHRNRILLLSKRENPPAFYEMPLLPFQQDRTEIARKWTVLNSIPKPSKVDIKLNPNLKYGSQPTSMDISHITGDIVVLTYKTAYLIKTQQAQSTPWQLEHPESLILPPLRQGESICFAKDGKTIYATSEKLPAPIYKLSRKD